MVSIRALAAAMGLHLALKVGSFAINIVLTRSQTAEMRGVSFALDLYVNSAVFLSKESVRAVNARRGCRTPLDVSEGFSFSLVSALLFLCVAMPLGVLHAALSQPASFLQAAEFWPCLVIIVGVLLEQLGEPWYHCTLAMGQFQRKVWCEGLALTLRLLVVAIATRTRMLGFMDGAVIGSAGDVRLAFHSYSAGVAAHGMFVWWFYWFTVRGVLRRHPSAVTGTLASAPEEAIAKASREGHTTLLQSPFRLARAMRKAARRSSTLFAELFSESVLRLILTEGEKVVLAAKGNLSSQGIYDVISGLGALIVRLVFRLWEDFAFSAWSRPDDGTDDQPSDAALRHMASAASPKRTETARAKFSEPSAAPAYVTVAKWDLLFAMLKIAVHFGALAAAFGPPLAARVLWSLFGGSRTSDWTGADAVDVLVAYIYYIPLLGVNGLLEAFVRATSTEHALRRLKGWMVLCSLAYIALCYVSLFVFDLGAVGLLYANSINLAIRIAVSAFTIETGVASPSGLSLSGRDDGVGTTWWVARTTPNAAVLTTYIVAFASARIVPLLFSDARSRHEDSVGLRVTEVNPAGVDALIVLAALFAGVAVITMDETCSPLIAALLQRARRR
jgi:oligosaccharide translocation protein RFT1